MRKFLQNPFLKKLRKFKKLKGQLEVQLSNGTFRQLSQTQRTYILARLSRLFNGLRALTNQYKIGFATAAFVSFTGMAQAQFTSAPTPFPKALKTEYKSNPTIVDYDKDSDQDLFAISDGKIFYFRNPGSNGTFVPVASNPFDTLTNVVGLTFFDIDADNDNDAFVVKSDSITLFKNNGSNLFAQSTDIQNPFSSLGSISGPQLEFINIDGDADMDATIISNGDVLYYQNNAGVYTEQTGTNNPFDALSGATDLAFLDTDNDSDLDVYVGSKFGNIIYYENNVGSFTLDNVDNKFANYLGGPSNVYLTAADLTNDGKTDVILGDGNGYFHYHDGAAALAEVDSKTSPLANGFFLHNDFNQVDFIDLDGDNDEDALIVILRDSLLYLKNDGSGNFSNASNAAFAAVQNVGNVAFTDLDGDNDQDLFVGNDGEVEYYRNDNGTFVAATPAGNPFAGISSGHTDVASISFYDIDGDGDEDAFFPTNVSGTFYFRNDASTFVQVTVPADNPVNAIGLGGYYNLDFFDINNDTRPDAIGAHHSGTGTVDLYLNSATGFSGAEEFALNPFDAVVKPNEYPHVTFVDYDNDGDLDAVFGGDDITVYKQGIVSGINDANSTSETSKIFSNESLVSLRDLESNGEVMIFNTIGSLVYKSTVKSGDSVHSLTGQRTGVYLVKVVQGDQLLTKKVFIK